MSDKGEIVVMYNHKFVAAIKSNGKVLREFSDIIYIPFGSEYSLLLKNLNSVRAEVNVSIDGVNITPDGLIVNAGQEINLERSLANGDLTKGNALKFIERTGKIEKHRGVGTEDGLIRIAFKFEKVQPQPVWVWPNYVYPTYTPGHWEWKPGYYPNGYPYIGGVTYRGDTAFTNAVGTTTATSGTASSSLGASAGGSVQCGDSLPQNGTLRSASVNCAFTSQVNAPSAANDVGITVPGSESKQQFQTVSSFTTEAEEHIMILRLLGETEGGKTVKAPVTVKAKARCSTCGHNNKATAHFCVECGTALEIV